MTNYTVPRAKLARRIRNGALVTLVTFTLSCASKSEPTVTPGPTQAPTQADIAVTKSPEKPKTPAVDSVDYAFIEQLTVPGYSPIKKRPAAVGPDGLTKTLIADKGLPSGWRIAVDVAFGRCTPQDYRCWNATTWENKRNPVVDALPKVHREDPNLVVITTPIDLAGTKVVSVYILSFVEHSGSTKMRQKAQWQSFGLYATNGTHYVHVTGKKDRGIARDIEALQKKLPRSTLTNETRRVFSVYHEQLKSKP